MSSSHHFGYQSAIVEGIGPVSEARSLIGQHVQEVIVTHPAMFQCFIDGVELVYGSDDSPCRSTLVTDTRAERISIPLHPNPLIERLFFELPDEEAGPGELRITDTTGKLILHRSNLLQSSIQVDNLPPGIYLVHITTRSGQRSIGKFVKMD